MPHTETEGFGERCKHDSLETPVQQEGIYDGPTNKTNHTDQYIIRFGDEAEVSQIPPGFAVCTKNQTKTVSQAQQLLLVAPYEIVNLLIPPLGKAQTIPEMQWDLGSKLI